MLKKRDIDKQIEIIKNATAEASKSKELAIKFLKKLGLIK